MKNNCTICIERTITKSEKIYCENDEELVREINKLNAKIIFKIIPIIPDYTTTKHCYQVYYESYQ